MHVSGESMADYEHDIFISYSRVGATTDWLERHLVPMLSERLTLDLGRDANIFFDRELEAGDTWPATLGHKLAKSRVLLALWSKPFLQSKWCVREVAIMRARENALNLRSAENSKGIVAISIIHDGETVPPDLDMIQRFEIKSFYNTRMTPESTLCEGLYERIMEEAKHLAKMIEAAPTFQEHWPEETADAFFQTFYQSQHVGQIAPPRFSI